MTIEKALSEHRYETARRLCLQHLATPPADPAPILLQLHTAYRRLGDIRACRETLSQITPTSPSLALTVQLRLAEDYQLLSSYDFYRDSEESRAGLTGDEYEKKYRTLARELLDKARASASLPEELALVTSTLERLGLQQKPKPTPPPPAPATPTQNGSLSCRILHPDGRPLANTQVTLGLQIQRIERDPNTYFDSSMHYYPKLGPDAVLLARTNNSGLCTFPSVPSGTHEYLAITHDSPHADIATRFLAQSITVHPNRETHLDLTATEWQSAPPRHIPSPFTESLQLGETRYRRIAHHVMANPFYFRFPRQIVHLPLPENALANPRTLLLLSSQDPTKPHPFQITGNQIAFFADLPQLTDRTWALYQTETSAHQPPASTNLSLTPEPNNQTAILRTGRAEFRIPFGTATDSQAPLLAVRGEDRIWRGQGRLLLPPGITVLNRQTSILESGPLLLRVRVHYQLSNHQTYSITWTAHENEAYLQAEEISPPLENAAFEFSLAEFINGRGFLHWTAEHGNVHWKTLQSENREIARLQESVAWWIPPQGFGYAMTADSLTQHDYIGVYTLRRGEWIDRAFEKIAHGPGDDHRELDWPYPEMMGSTISMISAHTAPAGPTPSGDAFFRFQFFDGLRHWGILVSSLEKNDGCPKEIAKVQHKNSSPRLQDFLHWRLDEQDSITRPSLVVRRQDLPALRAKRTSPVFQRYWQDICTGKTPGVAAGVRFAVEGDPRVAWRKKLELVGVAHIRAKMTLLGRDYSDMYSPVGGRPITPWAEEYDLIAASGVFSPDEERLVRSFLMLMGHLYMSPDFMNWKFNARNANFEADRTDIVGVIGLTFHGNPDAHEFVRHAAERMDKTLAIYCTPGSGKWYENPACYYLQAAKCRMNFSFHMARHENIDPTANPRLKDFLKWGMLLLMPPSPHAYEEMRDGLTHDAYQLTNKVRRIPPIGDHAGLGPWVPEFYAFSSTLYRQSDPAFADLLLWGYQSGGADGGYHGNKPLLFSSLTESDMAPAPAPLLTSRKLEGFGAVFRGNFNQPDEFYLLFKQGPGGYRFHRTEGSIILFADGKPLVYDGGEAGETWRHSTLSFHKVHMPLAPGHVERFASTDALDFAQGVHPVALQPGQPVFLSDSCEHHLVEVAHQRFAEPNPADLRSVLWAKDEYVIIHDDLALPQNLLTHWHLQVVSDSHTGNWQNGYRFAGRFGTDLQLLFPNQSFSAEKIEQLPMHEYRIPEEKRFTTRHLMLTSTSPSQILAILRPLSANKDPLTSRLLPCPDHATAVQVLGRSIDDILVFSRHTQSFAAERLQLTGRYAALLRRPTHTDLLLLDGNSFQWQNLILESTGPRIHLRLAKGKSTLSAEGTGAITIRGLGQPLHLDVKGHAELDRPPR